MDFLKDKFTNNTGFFQGGKSFGGKGVFGDTGVLSGIGGAIKDKMKSMKPKPCAGMPGVCPYTCRPLDQPGVAEDMQKMEAGDETSAPVNMSGVMQGINPSINRSNIGQESFGGGM